MAKKTKNISALKITSKKDGFRRAGIVHSGTRLIPIGELTKEQIESLKNEPLLIVEDIEAEEEPEGEAPTIIDDGKTKGQK